MQPEPSPHTFDPTTIKPGPADWDPLTYELAPPSPAEPPRPARMREALAAPRCAHIKLDGSRCGCPALQGKPLCRFHIRALRGEPQRLAMPVVEDAFSVQLALMRVVRGLEQGTLAPKVAALMLYALQIATMNLKRLEAAVATLASSADIAREKSLAEELLDRLDDKEFCGQLTAAQREFPVENEPNRISQKLP